MFRDDSLYIERERKKEKEREDEVKKFHVFKCIKA